MLLGTTSKNVRNKKKRTGFDHLTEKASWINVTTRIELPSSNFSI